MNAIDKKRTIKLLEDYAEKTKKEDDNGDAGANLKYAFAKSFAEVLAQGYELTDLDWFKYCPQYTGDYWKNNMNHLNSEKHQKILQTMGLDGEEFRKNVIKQIQKKNREKAEKEKIL